MQVVEIEYLLSNIWEALITGLYKSSDTWVENRKVYFGFE